MAQQEQAQLANARQPLRPIDCLDGTMQPTIAFIDPPAPGKVTDPGCPNGLQLPTLRGRATNGRSARQIFLSRVATCSAGLGHRGASREGTRFVANSATRRKVLLSPCSCGRRMHTWPEGTENDDPCIYLLCCN